MLKRQLIFNGLQTTWWFLFCVVAVLVAVALVVMLLRYERRLVPRKVGYTLLGLRLSVLMVLLLTLLQPIISWSLDRERTGRIVVAVDLSESMSTADHHAAKAEKLRWARALGMIGNSAINSRLDRWETAFEEDREPEWVDDSETSDPEKRKQLQQARRENLDAIFSEVGRLSRKEIARRLLTGTASPLLKRLEELGNVDLVVFAGKTESADAQTLHQFVQKPPSSLLTGISDLGQAMTPSNSTAESSPVMGVVLLTDGRDNGGLDVLELAGRLRASSMPVYPVLLGSELQPKDLAIASLDYPLTAFKDDRPLLRATLNTTGFEGQELTIVLESEAAEPITKTIIPTGPATQVDFELNAQQVGRHQYTIRTEVQPGETRDDNNRKSFGMTVVDDQMHVLLLEGEARWEFRFLDNALTRDERVDVKKVVFHQPYLGVLPDTYFPRRLDVPDNANNLEDSPFAESELVILGDVAPAQLPPVAWELLEKFVSDSGGTLVMVAGKRHFPLAYRSPIVDRLLPLTKLRPLNITGPEAMGSPTERGFHIQLTPEGEAEPMFQFDADENENRNIWKHLPGHLWGLVGEAKPGATVLAHAVEPDEDATLDATRRGALIVHQHYGFGQVLWIGIDSTWRWRHRVGDQYHHRFWGQLSRWAAENKTAAGNQFVRFGPERTDIELGEDAVIRARWTQQFLRRFPKLKAKVELYRLDDESPPGKPDKPFSTLVLKPADDRPLIHEVRAVALPAGEYRIKLLVNGADLGPEEIETSLFVHETQTAELSDLSANRRLLSQLADVSGGRLFLPNQLDQLPEMFRDLTQTSTQRREIALWDHWLIMLVFFALLTAEWVTRKLNGLP